MAPTHDGGGYWLVTRYGGVPAYGDAAYLGSLGNLGYYSGAQIVGISETAADAAAGGYWLVGSDGGVFAFGDAQFYGSISDVHLAAPVVGVTG